MYTLNEAEWPFCFLRLFPIRANSFREEIALLESNSFVKSRPLAGIILF